MFDDAKKYTDTGLRTQWDKYFRVYRGQRVIRNYEGISDPVIRESFTIVETLVANIASGLPKFHFIKTNEEQTDETDVLNGMLDYYMICNEMGLKNQEWVRDTLLYGTAILHVDWRDGKPWITNIPLRDFFVDPTSTGMVRTTNPALYAGYEYLARKEVLARERIFDPEMESEAGTVGKWVPKYQNLNEAIPEQSNAAGQGGDRKSMDKVFKDLFNHSTLGDSAFTKQLHIIKLYDLNTGRVLEIANRKVIIFDEPTWCQRDEQTRQVVVMNPDGDEIPSVQKLDEIKPFLPFAVLRDYVDTSLFYGEGEMAVIMQDAELLNDYEAMDIDNNAYQNTPMYTIDPQFADIAPEIETISGAVYPIPKGALNIIERPQLSADLTAKKDAIVARMRSATGADEVVQGISQDQSRITATEVSSTLSQAQTRFSTKISNLESEGYAQLAQIIFKLVQIFVSQKTAIRIVGKQGVYFKDYDPWDYNGEWEAHAVLDSTIKQQQLEVGQKLNQVYEQINNDPQGIFNPVETKRWTVQHIDPDFTDEEFNELLAAPKPQGPSPEQQQQLVDIKRSEISAAGMIYRYAQPFEKAQIDVLLGLNPDPMHEAMEAHQATQMGAQQADLLNPNSTADNKPEPAAQALLKPVNQPPAMQPAAA